MCSDKSWSLHASISQYSFSLTGGGTQSMIYYMYMRVVTWNIDFIFYYLHLCRFSDCRSMMTHRVTGGAYATLLTNKNKLSFPTAFLVPWFMLVEIPFASFFLSKILSRHSGDLDIHHLIWWSPIFLCKSIKLQQGRCYRSRTDKIITDYNIISLKPPGWPPK
jgi:hypothetical protein